MNHQQSSSSSSWFQGLVFVVLAASLFWLASRSMAPEHPLMPGVKVPAAAVVAAPAPIEAVPATAPEAAPAPAAPAAAAGGDSWN